MCTLVISSRWGSRAFLAWNPVALCSLPLRAALSAKAIHQRIDTFIRRPNTSRPEYLRHCCRSLHFSLIGDFDQIFIFAPELLEVQATHLSICGSICHILTSQAIYLEIRINTLIQGARSWQAFGKRKKCLQFFRRTRIC